MVFVSNGKKILRNSINIARQNRWTSNKSNASPETVSEETSCASEKLDGSLEVEGATRKRQAKDYEFASDTDDFGSKKSNTLHSNTFNYEEVDYGSNIPTSAELGEIQKSDDLISIVQEELSETKTAFEIFSNEFSNMKNEVIQNSYRIEILEKEKIIIIRRICETRKSRNRYRRNWISLSSRIQKFSIRKNIDDPDIYKSSHLYPVPYSTLRNNNSKKLRFNKTLNYVKKVVQEEDIETFIVDFLKFVDQEPTQKYRSRLTFLETISLKSKASLSRYQLEAIKKYLQKKIGADFLPQIKLASFLAAETCMINLFESSQVPQGKGKFTSVVQCKDVESLLKWRLEKLSASKQLIFNNYTKDEIVVAIGGDCGGGSTKICIIIANVLQPNSVYHVSTIAVFDDTDCYESIRNYIQPLLDQLNKLDSITYSENGKDVTRKVHQKLVGDFKLVSESCGHKKQNARFFCALCEEENPKGPGQRLLRDLDLNRRSAKRDLKSYRQYSVNGEKGVKKGLLPILEKIQVSDYLIPMLHLVTGVFVKYFFWQFWKNCVFEDNCTSFEIFADREKTLKTADNVIVAMKRRMEDETDRSIRDRMKAEIDAKTDERLMLDVVVDGMPDGKLRKLEDVWEKLGATRRAFFQTFNGNHVQKILTSKGVESTFQVFTTPLDPTLNYLRKSMEQLAKIMHLSSNIILDDPKIDELERSIKEFAMNLKAALPEETITQKLHTLLFHVVDSAKVQKTLGVLSEQGVEATHAFFNRLERRFCSFNKKCDRYLYVVKELLCANMAHDLESSTPKQNPVAPDVKK